MRCSAAATTTGRCMSASACTTTPCAPPSARSPRRSSTSSKATPNIIGEIKRHFRDKGWSVRVPRGLQELNVQLSRLMDQLTVQLSRSPTIPELAKASGSTEEEVLEALESGRAYSSLSLSSGGGGGDGDEGLDPLEAIGNEEHQYG